MKNNKVIYIFLLIIFFVFIGKAYQNKVFSPHFVDEEDNFVLGKYLLKGEKLYKDLFSHHQPLGYVFSAGVQKVTEPNSLFLLVKRHREVVIAWSFVWAALLVARFGLPMLLTTFIYELTKIYIFGHLFLSESLVVYPLLYLTNFSLEKRTKAVEYLFIGVCIGLVIFLLSPLWPLVFLLTLLMFFGNINKLKVELVVVGFGIIMLLIIPFISIKDYINDAYLINFQYYIPRTSKDPWFETLLNGIITPLIALTTKIPGSQILFVMQVLSVTLLVNLLFLLKNRRFSLVLLTVFILGISNIRFVTPGLQYYSGFHILPWFMLLIFFCFYLTFYNWKNSNSNHVKFFFVLLSIPIFGVSITSSKQSVFENKDVGRDFYINYSRQFDFGIAVNIMKSENDTLFVVPDEWLIYWQADIKHATKMLNYYAWMTDVEELKDIVESNFKTNPPTYFYCDCKGHYFGLENYWNLYSPLSKNGDKTKLLVLKEKVKNLSEEQKTKFEFYNFTID